MNHSVYYNRIMSYNTLKGAGNMITLFALSMMTLSVYLLFKFIFWIAKTWLKFSASLIVIAVITVLILILI